MNSIRPRPAPEAALLVLVVALLAVFVLAAALGEQRAGPDARGGTLEEREANSD